MTDYCSEVLGHETTKSTVDVQLRVARFHLGVPKDTALCCLCAEMGWLPAAHRRQLAVLRYYNRLMQLDVSRTPRRVFESTVNTPNSWAWRTKDLLTSLGLDLYWNLGCPILTDLMNFYVKENMKDEWRAQVGKKAKLRFYRAVKKSTAASPYVLANIPRGHRSLIARLLCRNLRLRVETGRWEDELLHERTCQLCACGEVEDEGHFLFRCPALDCLRSDILGRYNILSHDGVFSGDFIGQ